MRHGWLQRRGPIRVFIRKLEGDPRTQYIVHKWGMRTWIVMTPIVTAVCIWLPGVWLRVGLIYVVWISHYANWTSDATGLAATEAASEGAVSEFMIEAEETASEAAAARGAAGGDQNTR